MDVRRHRAAVPVVIGVGDLADRVPDDDLTSAKEPLSLLEEAARLAAKDAGPGAELLAELDSILVVNVAAWVYRDLPGSLGHRLGATPRHLVHSVWGGNWPTKLLDQAAARI
ncbi:MAG TPA: acetyl-CoA acetyltransferase, partial [Actinomycetota bacterium]|nr:acetyl-CoA acetyltransferase [Actinomycetota bacterium]